MQIRRLDIENFRGIKNSTWIIPPNRELICLIGPGDSGKTTILDALYLTLGDRYLLNISDTDFYNCDSSTPICIRAVVTDLPQELLKESAFGLHMSGIDDAGAIYQDPSDEITPCLIIQLKIDSTHEPIWTVERMDGSESTEIRSSSRSHLAVFKVDERVDVHLRWTNTSALGRLSRSGNSVLHAMASATRAAGLALAEYEDRDLAELTSKVQTKINEAGGGNFSSITPGLDVSISSSSGNLALYEENVPLTKYGLGSKRIAGLAIQQIASLNKSILLIDEIETGLEPHRLVRLMLYLRDDPDYSQVLLTTHSPIAVEQAMTENLAVVRSVDGMTTVNFLPDNNEAALKLRRSRPSSFLANKIIIAEGRTEEGILAEFISHWDSQRIRDGLSIASGEGVVVQDGESGGSASRRTIILNDLGYSTALFIDNDDRSVDEQVAKVVEKHIPVVRWEVGNSTEKQIVSCLPAELIDSFIQLALETRADAATVLSDLKQSGLPQECDALEYASWSAHDIDANRVREIIAKTSVDKKWFKTVDGGKLLGRWLIENISHFNDTVVQFRLEDIKNIIYPAPGTVESSEETDAGE